MKDSADLLDHPVISQRYFFPRRDRFEEVLWVDCGDDVRLACSFRRKAEGALTMVHFHGNGEIVSDYFGDFTDRLERMGLNVLLAEYRGYGMSTGKPALAAMLNDVDRVAAAAMEAARVPAERLLFFGRSIGSLYAVHGASLFPRAAGLIVESGIADPLERILVRVRPDEVGASEEELSRAAASRFNAQEKLARFEGPVLVLHTRHDGLLEPSHAERLFAWAPSPGKRLRIFEEGNHNSILFLNYAEYFALVEEFVTGL